MCFVCVSILLVMRETIVIKEIFNEKIKIREKIKILLSAITQTTIAIQDVGSMISSLYSS